MDSQRIERDAAAWLARREGGDWDEADAAALEAWLRAGTAHRVAFLRLQAAWDEAGRLQALAAGLPRGEVPARGAWNATLPGLDGLEGERPRAQTGARDHPDALAALVFRPAPAARSPRRRGVLVALAASAALLLLAVGGYRHAAPVPLHYLSALGEITPVVLGDGSDLVLGSDSEVEVRLSARQRAIALGRGEAIFEVVRDPQRPFVVEAGTQRVVAVGTRFSVRRMGEEVSVVVTEGSVRLEPSAAQGRQRLPSALLPAGSVAVAGPHGVSVRSVGLDAAARQLAWRDGDLSFDDLPLDAAVAEFNRYNARKLVVADSTVAALRVGGSFRWAEPERFADLLEQMLPVRVERLPDRVLLHQR